MLASGFELWKYFEVGLMKIDENIIQYEKSWLELFTNFL